MQTGANRLVDLVMTRVSFPLMAFAFLCEIDQLFANNDGTGCHDLSFLNVELVLSQFIHSPLSLSSRGCLVLLRFLP